MDVFRVIGLMQYLVCLHDEVCSTFGTTYKEDCIQCQKGFYNLSIVKYSIIINHCILYSLKFFFLLLKGKYWLHLKYCTKVYGILVFCSVILVMFNCCSLSLKSENVVWFMCKIWTCRDYIHRHSGNNVYVTFLTEQGFLWGFCDGELCLFFCI